ncbi:MAG: hypothetical protein R3293_26755 [Candidatus Promineifilaceae bacterium]|nr:hypothetical protein [Candidatus Promineifilaceae bacterium]
MSRATKFFILFLIGLITLIVSLVSSTFLFAFGLILYEFLVYPLALCVSSVFTAITATGFSNWLIKDGRHTTLRPVILATEAAAVVLALLLILLATWRLLRAPIILFTIPAALLLAVTAVFAAQRYRTDQPAAAHEKREAAIWIILALAAVPLTIFIASLFGWAGA